MLSGVQRIWQAAHWPVAQRSQALQAAAERANLAVFRARAEQRMAAARLAEILRLDPAIELVPADAELAPVTVVEAGTSNTGCVPPYSARSISLY